MNTIQAGIKVRLRSGGRWLLFLGGLNSMFVIEHGGNEAEVIETVTRTSGKVRLSDGYELAITLKDVELNLP